MQGKAEKSSFIIQSFSSEWQEVIQICLLFPDAFTKAQNCIRKSSAAFRLWRLQGPQQPNNTRLTPKFMKWGDLIEDLMEEIPFVVQGRLGYTSRFLLLPIDAQKNLIMLAAHNKNNISQFFYGSFGTFLVENVQKLSGWSQMLVRKHFLAEYLHCGTHKTQPNRSHTSSTFVETTNELIVNRNGNRNQGRNQTVLSAEAESYLNTLASYTYLDRKRFAGCAEESFYGARIKNEQTKESFNSYIVPITQVMNGSCEMSKMYPISKKTLDILHKEDNKDAIEENLIDSIIGKNAEQSGQTRQKLKSVGGSETHILKVPSKKLRFDEMLCVKDKDFNNTDINYYGVKALSSKDDLPQQQVWPDEEMKKLRQMLQSPSDLSSICRYIVKIAGRSCIEMESICHSLATGSLDETELFNFIQCIESEELSLSSTVKQKIISESLLEFLKNLKRPMSRNMHSCLQNWLKFSKNEFIKSILVPLLFLGKEKSPQENVLFKILNSDVIENDDFPIILHALFDRSSNEQFGANCCVIRCLTAILGKVPVLPAGAMSAIILMLLKNGKQLMDSIEVPKLILLMVKQYKASISIVISEINLLLQSNKTFLRRTAIKELNNLME